MLSVGGALFNQEDHNKLSVKDFEDLEFISNNESAYRIHPPILTTREARYLNGKLPQRTTISSRQLFFRFQAAAMKTAQPFMAAGFVELRNRLAHNPLCWVTRPSTGEVFLNHIEIRKMTMDTTHKPTPLSFSQIGEAAMRIAAINYELNGILSAISYHLQFEIALFCD